MSIEKTLDKITIFLSIFGLIALNTGRTITENGNLYLMIIIGSFFWAVIRFLAKKMKINNQLILMQTLFLFFCYISSRWAYSPGASSAAAKSILLTTIIIFTFSVLTDKEENILFFCKAFIYAQIATLLYFSYKHGIDFLFHLRSDEVVNSMKLNANTVGIALAYSSFISWIYFKITEKRLYSILAIFFTILALITASRKVFILLIILYTGYYLMMSHKPITVIAKILISAGIIYGLYLLLTRVDTLNELIGNRIEEVTNFLFRNELDEYSSTGQRLNMIEFGRKLFLEKPWIGWGIANAAEMSEYGTYLHNDLYELLCGVGLVGAIIYYIRYFYALKNFKYLGKEKNFIGILFSLIPLSTLILEYLLVSYNHRMIQVLICVSIGNVVQQKISNPIK